MTKLHKLSDRLATPERLHAKDAGDIYRLFDAVASDDMTTRLRVLLDDDRSRATTTKALAYVDQLFVAPAGTGTRLAVDTLRAVLPADTVRAAMTVYAAELRGPLGAP